MSARREASALLALVMLGSMIGGVLRWLVGLGALHLLGPAFPWATLAVNVVGSFVITLYATLTGPDGRLMVGPRQRQFVMTGICGGFTTFSLFSLETVLLAGRGDLTAAAANVVLSVVAWLVAAWGGHAIASKFNRLDGR